MFDSSVGGLVSEDEMAVQGCADWIRSLEIAIGWLKESIENCKQAEALTDRTQASALAELRDAARKLSNVLIEGEEHIWVVTAPIAQRMQERMHALQNPLIAIFADTPSGFLSWPNILDQFFDALLAALARVKTEGRHVVTLIATSLSARERNKMRELSETGAEGMAAICPSCQTLAPIASHGSDGSEESLECPRCKATTGLFLHLERDLKTGGRLAQENAGVESLCTLRSLMREQERFGGFDLSALNRLRDWLIAKHGMTREQVQTTSIARLVELIQEREKLNHKGALQKEAKTSESPKRQDSRTPVDAARLTPTQQRNDNWLEEWNRNEYGSIAAFAQAKGKKRSTMSKALRDARKRG